MDEALIVEAARSPFGKRGGGLAAMHPVDLLGAVMKACIDKAGIDPAVVGQVVGGCVEQVGEQAANVTRAAWIAYGLGDSIAAVSIDSACGSSQQALGLAAALVRSGTVDVAMACGLGSMSRLPIASSFLTSFTAPPTQRIAPVDHIPAFMEQAAAYGAGQFGCAERIAEIFGVSREEADRFGFESQHRAGRAWHEERFASEVVTIEAPSLNEVGELSGARHAVGRDEGLRETSLERLAQLKPVAGEQGVHTAATSSQIADGATAILLANSKAAKAHGLRPRARIVDHCHVGVDPVLMLSGPIDATKRLLERNALAPTEIDVYEINEAFAAVPLMWLREFDADPARLNPNGGAIALGHPVGATGLRLVMTALGELERSRGSRALISMCAGAGLGTGTLIERVS